MIGYARHKLSKLAVHDTGKSIKVTGVNFHALMKDIGFQWETSVLEKYMFKRLNSYTFQVNHFFALDLLYMLETLRATPGTRVPKRTLIALVNLLKTRTWLAKIEIGTKSIVDMSKIKGLFPFDYKDYQVKFIEHYGRTVPAYNLRGYMLDAGAGTGKTATNLALGEALGSDKVICVVPKNAIDEVWRHTIDDLMQGNQTKAWVSTDNLPLDPTKKHFVVHYEYLGKFVQEMDQHKRHFKKSFVIIDESHNFNRPESQRTEQLVELCTRPGIAYTNFASGTPILALGNECIPFIRVVDRFFDKRVEENFRKIYGRTAKKANEILRNRIGHLKYHVPKQDVVKVDVTEEIYTVKVKGGEKYTLPEVSKVMGEYIKKRKVFYQENKKKFEDDYYKALDLFITTLKTPKEKAEFEEYRKNIKTICSGYDPRTMRDISMMCNRYERTQILPTLPGNMRQTFRDAKSVVKYPDLKVMGEALGNILGKLRTECNKVMLHAIEFEKLIDSAEKKTLIFTSYVDVVDETHRLLKAAEYEPILVYGDTNRELSKHVRTFYKDPDINPMIATLQSLSTAVPITCANNVIFLNQPFREGIKIQSVSRVARLGQDKPVTVWNVFLDTGDVPNLSTRSNDIMEWSREQVSQIIGNKNLDPETLSFEDSLSEDVKEPEVLVEDCYLSRVDLAPITLYRPIDANEDFYTDSRQRAILESLRYHTGEQVIYDWELDVYRGSDGLLDLSVKDIALQIIKPKEEEQWRYRDSDDLIPGALLMTPDCSGIVEARASVSVSTDSLTFEKVY